MLEGVANENFDSCKGPIGLATRTRYFDELWIDSSRKYYLPQCGVLRTVSTGCS